MAEVHGARDVAELRLLHPCRRSGPNASTTTMFTDVQYLPFTESRGIAMRDGGCIILSVRLMTARTPIGSTRESTAIQPGKNATVNMQ